MERDRSVVENRLSEKTSKFNLYGLIHKYARKELNRLVEKAGSCDFFDAEEKAQFNRLFDEVFEFLNDHAQREDMFYHPLFEKVNSSHLLTLEREHEEIKLHGDQLKDSLSSAKTADDFYQFYLSLAKFQSEYLNHLDHEETHATTELLKQFDEGILREVNGELLRAIPKDLSLRITKAMLSAINNQERIAMFSEMKKTLPSALFQVFCDMGASALSAKEAEKLFRGIESSSDH